MAKNLLNKMRFNAEAAKRGGAIPKKDSDVWAPPWMASYARRLLDDKAGIIIASPHMPEKACPDPALDRYNKDIRMFFSLLGNAEKLFLLRSEEEKILACKMFRQPSLPHIITYHGKMDAVALLRGRSLSGQAHYNAGIVSMMRSFTDKCSSFVIVGTVRTAAIACEGLYLYLVNRGMHGKKIAPDARFMYDNT